MRQGRHASYERWTAAILPAVVLCAQLAAQGAWGGEPSCNDTPPALDAVVAAIFAGSPSSCDLNLDGRLSSADLVAGARLAGPTPTPQPPTETSAPTASPTPPRPTATPSNPPGSVTATGTPPTATPPGTQSTPTQTETAFPSRTATPTTVPTATPTDTPRPCPSAGADLVVDIDNQTGSAPISVLLSGERISDDCIADGLSVSYGQVVECGVVAEESCARIDRLAPGLWRHSVQIVQPESGQVQHRKSLLTVGDPPNRLAYVGFASVFSVTTTANTGDGSLRQVIGEALAAAKPALIQFDPTVFPAGVPTAIVLEFALPNMAADAVTIDGTDADGARGNRIIDAGGLGVSALSIGGANNHIVGMRLQNSGGNNRDVLNIAGAGADGNLVERTIVVGSGSADGIGIDDQAGKAFDATANVIRDCEVQGAADKGVKITTGSYARVERTWVHDNFDGGIQATLGGHAEVSLSLVEENRGGTAQNGLAANASDGPASTGFSELVTHGNIVRGNGANGVSVRGLSVANLRDDYLATNGTAGVRVFNDIGPPASAVAEGVSAVCNGVDGAVVADLSTADFGGGALGSLGNNAFTQNNLPAGGSNFRNVVAVPIQTLNNQWEHCGGGTTCDDADIAARDLADHGKHTDFVPAQAHRAQEPVVAGLAPTKGLEGERLHIFGSGFNVIDGHFAEDQCADVEGRNRCVPLRGNCVRIGGKSAPVEAVTPTMLVVRWPFTCIEPTPLTVTIDLGPTGATSNTFVACTNDE